MHFSLRFLPHPTTKSASHSVRQQCLKPEVLSLIIYLRGFSEFAACLFFLDAYVFCKYFLKMQDREHPLSG